MHKIIDEIINSTRKRIPQPKKNTIITRELLKGIKEKKSQNLIPIISEVKPSSPTKFIRNVTPIDASNIAKEMERAGAVAISVLTEPYYFKGSLENLEFVRNSVKIPVLRKDFIIDKLQIHEIESDLILLIAGILGKKLNEFVDEAILSGRQPLVEVHNKYELENALSTDTNIIGINNRDLNTMKVDISTTEKLIPLIDNRIIISESGISNPQDAVRIINSGADALLVGSYIMQGNIYNRTYELVTGNCHEART